jgi:hypothetical protein
MLRAISLRPERDRIIVSLAPGRQWPGLSRRARWRATDRFFEAEQLAAESRKACAHKLIALLVTQTASARSYRTPNTVGLCEPYVKPQKNDMADAEAICEAVTRANMRFVPTKTPEQQSGLMLHRTGHLLIRQQTSVINAFRL